MLMSCTIRITNIDQRAVHANQISGQQWNNRGKQMFNTHIRDVYTRDKVLSLTCYSTMCLIIQKFT